MLCLKAGLVEGWAIESHVSHHAGCDVAPDTADGDRLDRGYVVKQRRLVPMARQSSDDEHALPRKFLRR